MIWSLTILLIPLAFCLVPLAMPGWRSWLAALALGTVALGWVWLEVRAALSAPADDHGMAAALAVGFALLATVAFVAGLAARALGLVLQGRGLRRAQVLWTDALGLAAPALLLLWFWAN